MDPQALWLSAPFAAAKLAIALWFGQLALSLLDRRRVTLSWQIALAVATIVVSWGAVRTSGGPSWWTPAWMTSSLLAAAALVDCVRRWLSAPAASERASPASPAAAGPGPELVSGRSSVAPHGSQRIHDLIALVGVAITAVAGAAAVFAQLPASETLARVAAVAQMLTCAGLLGIVLATSFELTIGATGATLLRLNWRRLSRAASLCLLVQLAVSAIVITYRRDGATPVESLTPIFFALGMMIVSYIVWAIPRQMVALAARGPMQGQASLAVAGWLAVICLAVACGLPPTWPWNQVGSNWRGSTAANSRF